MKVFISPSAEGAWTIDPQQLATALRARCPLVHVIDVSDAAVAHCLEWTWPARNGPVEGSLDAACSTAVLDSGADDCAGFAVRFRALGSREADGGDAGARWRQLRDRRQGQLLSG